MLFNLIYPKYHHTTIWISIKLLEINIKIVRDISDSSFELSPCNPLGSLHLQHISIGIPTFRLLTCPLSLIATTLVNICYKLSSYCLYCLTAFFLYLCLPIYLGGKLTRLYTELNLVFILYWAFNFSDCMFYFQNF